MRTQKIRLSVIVLFYHGEKWIEGCVKSLLHQSLPREEYELILVDNGGSTPSVEKYANCFNTRVLYFPHNLGFAGGNNQALNDAAGEIIMLVNQDVILHGDCLHEMLLAFDRYPRAGAIGANMIMASSKDIIRPDAPLPGFAGYYRLSSLGFAEYRINKNENDIFRVDFISGNGLGIKKGVLADIGHYLFDASLVSYAEDLDLSFRLAEAGLKMYISPGAVLYHFREESFSGSPIHKIVKFIHISNNRLRVHYNRLPLNEFLWRLPRLILGISLKVARPDDQNRINILNTISGLILTPMVLLIFIFKEMARRTAAFNLFKQNK